MRFYSWLECEGVCREAQAANGSDGVCLERRHCPYEKRSFPGCSAAS